MATPTQGIPAGFSASTFRNAIKFAMQMGSPNSTSEKVTFKWVVQKEYAQEDVIDRPYDWTSTPTSTVTHADVIVDCAVEFGRVAGNITDRNPVGDFDSVRATITVLDEDFALVDGADLVSIGGDSYVIEYVQPLALFDVDVYQIHAVAVDES